jgi:histone-lysine N-methyltransferase SETD8
MPHLLKHLKSHSPQSDSNSSETSDDDCMPSTHTPSQPWSLSSQPHITTPSPTHSRPIIAHDTNSLSSSIDISDSYPFVRSDFLHCLTADSVADSTKCYCPICDSTHDSPYVSEVLDTPDLSHENLKARDQVTKKKKEEEIIDGIRNPLIHPGHLKVKWYGDAIGHGVMTNHHICQGDFICVYHGDYVSRKVGLEREKDREDSNAKHGDYIFFMGNICVDGTSEDGSLGRLINHSRLRPNSVAKCFSWNGTRYIIIKALTCMKPYTQITYDYGERRPEILKLNPWISSS